MPEPELNNLPPEAESAPPPAVEVEAEGAAAAAEPRTEIDTTPDPAKLKADIEELERKRKQAEEDAVYWRRAKAEARAEFFKGGRPEERQAPPQEAVPGLGVEPQPTDFDDYNKYVAALTDHRVRKARMEWDQDQTRREREKTQQERMQGLHTRLQEGYAKYPDYEEVAFDRTATHITPMIVDIIAECENPADLAYYLAKNRVEGVAISRMTPIRAAREIAKIEARLAGQTPAAQPPPRKQTGAPPPINPISTGASKVVKDPNKMTQREYEEWRLKNGARPF